MPDLPDYYTQAQISRAEAASFTGGLDANKSAAPISRDIYLATDTHILYVCFVDGTWTGFDAAILTQGLLTLYANLAGGGYQIKNLADPTAAQDAATKTYADLFTLLSTFNDHSARHEDVGADEISIEGLAGSPAQKAAASGLASLDASSKVVQKPADRLGVANLEWTANTLLKGAGVGADPTEIAAPTGDVVGTSDTQVLTEKTLTSPTIQGDVSAGTGLTMPAFTAGGDLSIGVYKLLYPSDLMLWAIDANTICIGRGTTFDRDLKARSLYFADTFQALADGTSFRTKNTNDNYIDIRARDTDVGLAEIARLQGAATAYFNLKFNRLRQDGVLGTLPIFIRKTADEIVNNSVTLQNDDALLLAVGANEVWVGFIWLLITTSEVSDFKWLFSVPSGGSIKGTAAFGGPTAEADLTEAISLLCSTVTAVKYAYWWRYVGGASAGNIQLQWAQDTAEVFDTKVLTNSLIVAHRLA